MNQNDAKSEKLTLRQKWSNNFLYELDLILEKCFLKPKNKKEHFITKEKIEVELMKLLQSQKKFSNGEHFGNQLLTQAAFDKISNSVVKIVTLDLLSKKVNGINISQEIVERDFKDVIFFDVYSIEFSAIFEKQKIVHSYTYQETFRFLSSTPAKPDQDKRAEYYCFPCIPNSEKLIIPIDYSK